MNALIVVAKRPQAGQTKTRLTPPLSPESAAELYERFLIDTLDLIRQTPNIKPIIAYLPKGQEAYFKTLAPDFELLPQCGDDLGERLDNALSHYLNSGFDKAIIMDSDSPTLPTEYLTQAFNLLDAADVVLGPCDDGGYYLIGLKRAAPRLLREVTMSTPTVVQDTIALAHQAGLSVELLPTWYDVDTVAELERLSQELLSLEPQRAAQTRLFFKQQSET
jgi:hypothetical protein